MDTPISFDKMFIEILQIVKLRSRDPRTKVACALVSSDHRKVHFGWNSMPSKLPETEEMWSNRDIKHSVVIHGEESAILNAHEDLHGWTCYLTMPPCPSCCRLLIHAGIKRVVYSAEHIGNTKYDYESSKEMLSRANIPLIKYEEDKV